MIKSSHIYAIAALAAVLTAASFGSGTVRAAAAAVQTVITNTSSNPVPVVAQGTTLVQDASALGRTPVSQIGDAFIPTDDFRASDLIYTVPAGKRLVVQQLFGQAVIGKDETVTMAKIGGYPVTFTPAGNGVMYQGLAKLEKSFASMSTQATYVFGPGTPIYIIAQRNVDTSGYTADVVMGFSGYLENAN